MSVGGGCVGVWVCGCVGVWVCGCVVCGCVGGWVGGWGGWVALDSVGYLCVNSVSAFTAAWLNASQSIRDDVQLNVSVAE